MFDFLFKRKTSKPSVTPSALPAQAPITPQPSDHAKQGAIAQADSLQGEDAAVDFILQCQFADARLKAAAQVTSRPALERLLKGVRNTDRRVAKLVQSRIDAIVHSQTSEQNALRCIEQAAQLKQQAQLMPNQVADLDRAWKAAGAVSTTSQQAFDEIRSALRVRLETQATLQRSVIDTLNKLKDLASRADDLDPVVIVEALTILETTMASDLASSEASSLPTQLAVEFNERQAALRQALALITVRYQSLQIRRQKLDEWESAAPESLQRDVLKREWQSLPALQADDVSAALQARFDAILPAVIAPVVTESSKRARPNAVARATDDGKALGELLDAMENALNDGEIRIASEHDRSIRTMAASSTLSDSQSARLSRVRAELGRLQSWAKWGGTVSREELLKAADTLAGQQMSPVELAKKVSALRDRWKSLDISSGPSTRELWERFDAACTLAYAPVAEHFKKLSEERQQNQLTAEGLIAEAQAYAVASGCNSSDSAAVDWKAIAQFIMQSTQAWQKLGTIERKEKKRLDTEFNLAIQLLSVPLTQQRSLEIARREQLIAEATNLRPADRNAPDMLRALQERWQTQSKSLPLERRDEQELWQRFRSACDAVFAKRKEAAVSADADRREHLAAKEALCVTLEAGAELTTDSITRLLRETRDAWTAIGPVPHAAESRIDARYKAAVEALQSRLDSFRAAASELEVVVLRRKLDACRSAENALLANADGTSIELENLKQAWSDLPASPMDFEKAVRMRFDAAATALETNDPHYAALLKANREQLMTELLRFEIVSSIDSPAELSRERLQMQVEVLKSSLKAGVKPIPQRAQLLAICGLAAETDDQTAERLALVIKAVQDVIQTKISHK